MQTFNQYYATDRDAREYLIKIILFTLLIYVCFFAYAEGWLGLWWMVGIVSVSTTRWMIAFHELFHLRRPEKLNFLVRLKLIRFYAHQPRLS